MPPRQRAGVAAMHEPVRSVLEQAIACSNQGRLPEALELFHRVLAVEPDNFDALHGSGIVCGQQGEFGPAAEYFARAAQRQPDDFLVHYNLGKALEESARHAEALTAYDRALALAPTLVEAHFNRALVLQRLGRPHEALTAYDQAIALRPADAGAYANRGAVLAELGRVDEALSSYDQAIALRPDQGEAYYNRGVVLQGMKRYREAMASYDRAVSLLPRHADAHYNRGIILFIQGRIKEAIGCLERALAISPEHAQAHLNEALCRLTLGELGPGFAKFEWRWQEPELAAIRARFPGPLWRGQDLAGRTILLWAEQGLGDALQFCRYVSKVAERGAKVILGVPAPLTRLLARLPGAARVDCSDRALSGYDYQCPLMSLPRVFGTTLATIPAAVPYLQADETKVAAWRERLGPPRARRIGLVWSGHPGHKNDHNRSIPLARFAPLLESARAVEFISVQQEVRAADRAALAGYPGLKQYGEWLRDMDDTAALLSCLDLVITVDTAIAHLAGALGRPVWVLLPYVPDWRWLLQREDSPWYPTARLFRQSAPGDWGGVLQRVAEELRG
jgi:tetratricopeptide (TPR) repeat protein